MNSRTQTEIGGSDALRPDDYRSQIARFEKAAWPSRLAGSAANPQQEKILMRLSAAISFPAHNGI
jgi:hypothetical protein